MIATNLTKQFGTHTVVNDVSFTLQPHTATALIGPNGAGKTTILSMLAGLLKPTTGAITKNTGQIGFLPQYPQFYPWMTALEFTEMAARLNGLSKKEARSRAREVLTFVGLDEALSKKIAALSGGMKQRLGIAQAIVHRPTILLLDEPVSALDPFGRRDMMNLLKKLQQTTTILYSTHILNDAEEMTDQILFLKDGALIEQGTIEDIRERYLDHRFAVTFRHEEDAQVFSTQHQFDYQQKTVLIPMTRYPTMQHLLTFLSQTTAPIDKIEQHTSSLEDIFVKVMSL